MRNRVRLQLLNDFEQWCRSQGQVLRD